MTLKQNGIIDLKKHPGLNPCSNGMTLKLSRDPDEDHGLVS